MELDLSQVIKIARAKQLKDIDMLRDKVNLEIAIAWYNSLLSHVSRYDPKKFPKQPVSHEDKEINNSDDVDNDNALAFGYAMKALIDAKKQRGEGA